jgi:hypothetical protein
MDSLSGKFELLPPVENELDIEGKLLAVKIGDLWLRACGQSNGVVNLIDVAVKKKVALEDIRHALPEMQKPQITFWCILSNFFAHCGETQIEEVMQSMVCPMNFYTAKFERLNLHLNLRLLTVSISGPRTALSVQACQQGAFCQL